MAQNITLWGASYSNVPSVLLPKTGGGTASFTDVSPTTCTDSDVASGKIYFKADGTQSTGTASGGGANLQAKTNIDPTTSSQTITADTGYDGLSSVQINAMPSGSAKPAASISSTGASLSTGTGTIILSKTVSNVPDVTAGYVASGTSGNTAITLQATCTLKGATTYTPTTSDQTIASGTYLTGTQTISGDANLVAGNIKSGVSIFGVNGSYTGGGGGGGLTLLKTYALGSLSTTSTSAADTGKSTTLTGYNDYDVLVVDVSVDTTTNNRHTSTVSMVYLTGTSNVNTKNTYTVGSNKWNSKLSSSGTGTTRQSTTAYGVYVNAATVSSSTMTLTFYYKYNSNHTGTINGSYTARIYGLKLYELIGG